MNVVPPPGPNTNRNENPVEGNWRRNRGAQKDRVRGTEGKRAQSRGGWQAENKETAGGGGEGMQGNGGKPGRAAGRGEGAADVWRRAEKEAIRQVGGARQKEGWRSRGTNGGEGAERERSWVRRNRMQGEAERGAAKREVAEMGARTGGHVADRGGGRWGERKDGVGGGRQRNGGRSNSTGRVGAPQGHGLGYKKLEELSGNDPSVVAITLSSHPALKDVLSETVMRKDLVELLCLVLSKAFKSRTDRGTLQHLGAILKDSGFFRTTLPFYLVGMESEFNPLRRTQYPQHLENILTILSEVNRGRNELKNQLFSKFRSRIDEEMHDNYTASMSLLCSELIE